MLAASTFFVSVCAAQTLSKQPSPDVKPIMPPLTAVTAVQPRFQLDPALPEYRRVESVSGKLASVGSSALTQLINRWGEDLKRLHPALDIEVTGGGSGSAPTALTSGNADLAPMSRPMNAAEKKSFQDKFGYAPTQITVSVDALAIYVNKNNPLKRISLRELDALYSLTLKRGGAAEIKTWGQLGLSGEWAQKTIRVFGPNSSQGMYGVFRADVLQGGEYRYDLRTEPVASAIVQGVGADDEAIGFASHVLMSHRAKPLALSDLPDGAAIELTQDTATSNQYPLARRLYIYVNRKPGTALSPALHELVRYVCSKQGQNVAIELGSFPLSAALSEKECLSALK